MAIINTDELEVGEVCTNTKSDYIFITQDKLENILRLFIENLKKSYHWITFIALAISILAALLTTEFKEEFLGIDGNIWFALFILLFILFFCLALLSGIVAIRLRNEIRLNHVINKIKNKGSTV